MIPKLDLNDESTKETLINGEYTNRIVGSMDYFPLCCSTGVLKNFTATPVKNAQPVLKPPNLLPDKKIKEAKSLRDLIRLCGARYPFPLEVTAWYGMSLIDLKGRNGTDDRNSDGYAGFKASQVTFFDRLLEDKDPKKGFRFSYNMTFALSHLIEWLRDHEENFGEVLISDPVPGGHGARVYGCILTMDKPKVEKYCKARLKDVQKYLLDLNKQHRKNGIKDDTSSTPNKLAY